MRNLFLTAGLVAGLISSSVAAAQPVTEKTRFDVYFAGLKAGEMTLAMTRDGGQYAVSGKLKSKGLIGAVSNFRFKAKAHGRASNARYNPTRYEESSDTGRRKSEKTIRYESGVPLLEHSDKPKGYWLKPQSQSDALDPLTAIWHLLRDRDGDDLCQLDQSYFDGARRVQLTTSDIRRDGEMVTCNGHYIRVGGFSRKEMREGDRFPFRITYVPAQQGRYRVDRLDVKTLRGRALLIRR